MSKNWLFSLETGKHNHYLYFHIAYWYIGVSPILTLTNKGGEGSGEAKIMLVLLMDSPLLMSVGYTLYKTNVTNKFRK